jgi:hypothetical protein
MGFVMQKIRKEFAEWKADLLEHKSQFLVSLILLACASILNYVSGTYVGRAEVAAVPDIFLNNFKAVDLSYLFVWGFMLVIGVFFVYPFIFTPKKLHYAIGMFSLLLAVRAGFIVLTHLKTPMDAIPAAFPWLFDRLLFQNDMFFSGHTALPFLGYLVFENKKIKYFMLASSIVLGLTVLLMHQHYTIDVVSAFFITYVVYKIGNRMF